jgi:hypothetical protein
MPKYETHEVRLSELIKHYIANLPTPEGWEILAIDLFTDVLVLKREEPESSSPDALRNAEDIERIEAIESPTQPETNNSLNVTPKTPQNGGD